jgi:flagellin
MSAGTGFEATARAAREAVKGFQNTYFAEQAKDSFLEEATNQALRLSELEGSGNTSSAEYSAVQGLATAAASLGGATASGNSGAMLSSINTARQTIASNMATAQSNANIKGITAENNFAQSDTIMGADIGAEMVNLTKFQILNQAGVSALTQANQSSQSILGLFR